MKLLFAFILSASALAPISLHAQTLDQARAFLDGVYRWDTNDNPDGQLADSKIYSPSLVHLFKTEHNPNGLINKLDFDPLCDCQDPGGLQYEINSIKLTGSKTALAEMCLRQSSSIQPSWRTLTLDLSWTKQGWRINDVHTSREPSLRAFLLKP